MELLHCKLTAARHEEVAQQNVAANSSGVIKSPDLLRPSHSYRYFVAILIIIITTIALISLIITRVSILVAVISQQPVLTPAPESSDKTRFAVSKYGDRHSRSGGFPSSKPSMQMRPSLISTWCHK